MEKEQLTSSFEVYNTCKFRDLCLRFLGEEPIRWVDVSSTPCPCNATYFKEVMAYARIIYNEEVLGSRLPYTHMQLVRFMTEKEKKGKVARIREIPLNQERLKV